MPISLKSTLGGGGTPEGSLVKFPLSTTPDITLDGVRYLRTGFIETNTSNFDSSFYALNRATVFQNTTFTPTTSGVGGVLLEGQGNDLLVFYGSNGRLYKVSTDAGVTWSSEQTFPCDVADSPIGCKYFTSGSIWVCATRAGRVYSSTNMTSWTQRYQHPSYVASDSLYLQIKAFSSSVVVVGSTSSGGALTTSSNGTTYTERTLIPNIGIRSVDFSGTVYMLGVNSNNPTLNHALTTTDFTSFSTKQILPTSSAMNNYISYANGGWFSNPQSGILYRSTNGDTWTLVDMRSAPALGLVSYQDGFYLFGTGSRSLDGDRWISNNLYVSQSATVVNLLKINTKYLALGTVGGQAILQEGNSYLFAGSPVALTDASQGTGSSLIYYVKIKT